MKWLFILFILIDITLADTKNDGKELYTKANCQKCHNIGENFDPNSINKEGNSSKVKTFKNIKSWVSNCDNYFSIGWFPQEQESVTKYLNQSYYKLKK